MPDGNHDSEQNINHCQQSRQKTSATNFYIILIILVIALYSTFVLTGFFLTGTREARDAIRRKEIKQNLTQIGIALQNYTAQQAKQEQRIQSNERFEENPAPRGD